ncbi:MAG: VIT and VWA domain-containing protein [Fimbriimonadales bacterium]|nr:MAG: inter-alpha-trypsin inhibitor domain-containing protein [Fimbriimonadales bacterium]
MAKQTKVQSVPVVQMLPAQPSQNGIGALTTPQGNLPLKRLEVEADIVGVFAQTIIRQIFQNPTDQALEAVYIFPLPDRAGVGAFQMTVNGRVIDGVLKERLQARREYEAALQQGYRAAMQEEERPNVFTLSVGNLMPGEEAHITLTLYSLLELDNGEATYRVPLVVAPRYIPGMPLDDSVGYGTASDTDAVPDASRITPPVLLDGFPNPVQLEIVVRIDGRAAPITDLRASLHNVMTVNTQGVYTVRLQPGERIDRDFILRFRPLQKELTTRALLAPDPKNPNEGTLLTLVFADDAESPAKLSDVLFVVDRSGSMDGWKMEAAKRATVRLIDSLHPAAQFGVLAFDNIVEAFDNGAFQPASDRVRFQATQWLAQIYARGGTEMLGALQAAIKQCTHPARGRYEEPPREPKPDARPIIVLITDGQVGNEEQILRYVANAGVTLYIVGIDEALNDAFLRRMAEQTGGLFMPIESEDRLDETLDLLRQRLSAPVLHDIQVHSNDVPLLPNTTAPKSPINLYTRGVAYVLQRWQGRVPKNAVVTVEARRPDGSLWQQTVRVRRVRTPVLRFSWARHMVRMLEDLYYIAGVKRLEQRIVQTSLQYGVLSRFTAFVAVDRSEQVNPGGATHRIVQPVEMPRGWQPTRPAAPPNRQSVAYSPPLDDQIDDHNTFGLIQAPPRTFLGLMRTPPRSGSGSRGPVREAPIDESESLASLRNFYRDLSALTPESPARVDQFLLNLLHALDSWLAEYADESPHTERVLELVDAILDHFQQCWDAKQVERLLILCREALSALLEQPSRRERWW